MKDYELQLKFFSEEESRDKSEDFFEKFWLTQKDSENLWSAVQWKVFNKESIFPNDVVFNSSFNVIPQRGGLIFTEEDYNLLQECMKLIGDRYFFIVEDFDIDNPPHESGPPLRFKFPSNIAWEQLIDGGYISIELFKMPHKNYYIFDDKGVWGKYVANDYKYPLDIIGVDKQYHQLFTQRFIISDPDREELRSWSPPAYKKFLEGTP
jgi:hypothetical protein